MRREIPTALSTLRVGPDEVLVVKLGDPPAGLEDEYDRFAAEVSETLVKLGLAGRSVVIRGDVEFAVVPRNEGAT